jgi:hypothetical protein
LCSVGVKEWKYMCANRCDILCNRSILFVRRGRGSRTWTQQGCSLLARPPTHVMLVLYLGLHVPSPTVTHLPVSELKDSKTINITVSFGDPSGQDIPCDKPTSKQVAMRESIRESSNTANAPVGCHGIMEGEEGIATRFVPY